MARTMPLLLLSIACFALPAAPARAQEPSIRDRWNALSQDEQRRILDNYERWKSLPQERRDLMKRRFERLDSERQRVREGLDENERRSLDRLRDSDRRQELTRRAKSAMRGRLDGLPPDLRSRIERGMSEVQRAIWQSCIATS